MVKVISLSNKAYATLSELKFGGESFSDVVLKLADKKESKKSILDFWGVWKDDEETKRIFDKILSNRGRLKSRKAYKW